MKCYRTLLCLLNVFILSSALAQNAAVAQPENAALPEPEKRPASGYLLRADGVLEGEVASVDESTLTLVPVPNAIVTFMQNRVVIAQRRTAADGKFQVSGLSPSAVYSVFVTHPLYFAGIPVVTIPHDMPAAANPSAAKVPGNRKEIFVSTALTRFRVIQVDGNVIQVMPREDFVAALGSGVLGSDLGGAIPGGAGGPAGGAGGGAGAGGGGSGGGGGGGGGGVGAGGLLGAAAIAAGVIAGSNSSSRSRVASPAGP